MKVVKDYLPSLEGLAGLLISVLRTVLAFHLKETCYGTYGLAVMNLDKIQGSTQGNVITE